MNGITSCLHFELSFYNQKMASYSETLEEEQMKLKAQNTLKANKKSANILREYLRENCHNELFENYDKVTLNETLSRFYKELRKPDGVRYKASSLVTIRHGINRYLKSPPNSKNFDIVKDSCFAGANKNFKIAMEEIKQLGLAEIDHHPVINAADRQSLYTSEHMRPDTPSGLSNKVQFDIRLYFFRRGMENMHAMKKTDFEIKKDEKTGLKYVVKTMEKMAKNSRDDTKENLYGIMPESPGSAYCPVLSFERYLQKLNPLNDKLWQKPLRCFPRVGEIWYCNTGIGEKTLSSFMTKLGKKCGLSRTYTNQSIRATAATILTKNMFGAEHHAQIMALNGQNFIKSLSQGFHTDLNVKMGTLSENVCPSSSRATPVLHFDIISAIYTFYKSQDILHDLTEANASVCLRCQESFKAIQKCHCLKHHLVADVATDCNDLDTERVNEDFEGTNVKEEEDQNEECEHFSEQGTETSSVATSSTIEVEVKEEPIDYSEDVGTSVSQEQLEDVNEDVNPVPTGLIKNLHSTRLPMQPTPLVQNVASAQISTNQGQNLSVGTPVRLLLQPSVRLPNNQQSLRPNSSANQVIAIRQGFLPQTNQVASLPTTLRFVTFPQRTQTPCQVISPVQPSGSVLSNYVTGNVQTVLLSKATSNVRPSQGLLHQSSGDQSTIVPAMAPKLSLVPVSVMNIVPASKPVTPASITGNPTNVISKAEKDGANMYKNDKVQVDVSNVSKPEVKIERMEEEEVHDKADTAVLDLISSKKRQSSLQPYSVVCKLVKPPSITPNPFNIVSRAEKDEENKDKAHQEVSDVCSPEVKIERVEEEDGYDKADTAVIDPLHSGKTQSQYKTDKSKKEVMVTLKPVDDGGSLVQASTEEDIHTEEEEEEMETGSSDEDLDLYEEDPEDCDLEMESDTEEESDLEEESSSSDLYQLNQNELGTTYVSQHDQTYQAALDKPQTEGAALETSTRFHDVTMDDIEHYSNYDSSRSNSTIDTKWSVKIFQDWSTQLCGHLIDFKTIQIRTLAHLLKRFFSSARPPKGKEEYHKNTLKNIRTAINTHLQDVGRNINIVSDPSFRSVNRVFNGLTKEEVKKSHPRKYKEIISRDDMVVLRQYFEKATTDPLILCHFVWFSIAFHFMPRGNKMHTRLTPTSLLFQNENNEEFVMLGHKTKQEKNQDGSENKVEKGVRVMYATGGQLCPVKMLKLLINKTDPEAKKLFSLHNADAAYGSVSADYWFSKKPLSQRRLNSFMQAISKSAKTSTRYSNHCVRATAIQYHRDAGTEAKHFMFQ